MHESQNDPEPEFRGPIWLHPYFLYVFLTVILFGGMVLIGYLAVKHGWIPDRGIGGSR